MAEKNQAEAPKTNSAVVVEGDGVKYRLGFNRKSVRAMERAGFDVTKLDSMPVSGIYDLVLGAFRTFQPTITEDEAFRVWESLDDKMELVRALAELYGACTLSLIENPTGESRMKWSLI